jgi:CheY-like chemotaxis protein
MPHASDYPAVHGSLLDVEDDAELAGLLQDVLNMSGYDVVLAGSNADALACLSSERRIEAAILDLSVTNGTTLPVADRLRSDRVPYVFASGSACTLPDEHRWAPFFSTPFPIPALINAVESCRATGVPYPAAVY